MAHYALDAENNLFHFRVFRFLDSQFPASIESRLHWSANFFDAICL